VGRPVGAFVGDRVGIGSDGEVLGLGVIVGASDGGIELVG